MRLIIVRHGETEWNSSKKIQGTSDTALSGAGLHQAKRLSERLQRMQVWDIYTSPLERTAQTAAVIGQACGKTPIVEDALIEKCFGEWEGLTFEQLETEYPDELKVWNSRPQDCVIPGAEPFDAVRERCERFVEKLLRGYPQNSVLMAVTHSLPAKLLVALSLELPMGRVHSLRMDNASISIVDFYPERAVLKLFNDTSHLERP